MMSARSKGGVDRAGLMEGLWIDDLYSFSHALQAHP